MEWQPIETFDPTTHRDRYLFSDGTNVILGHWYDGEDEPRMAYTGDEFPIFVTHWAPLPAPPA